MFFTNWINFETGEAKNYMDKYGNPAPCFRKKFEIEKPIKRAILYYSAIGVLKVYINGKEVDGDYMSPGWSDYRKRIPVYKTEVTRLLNRKNAIGVIAGDGWAVGKLGNHMYRCNYSDKIFVGIMLEIETADGEKMVVKTDRSWKAKASHILRTDNYMGEFVDLRLKEEGFSKYDYDDGDWSEVEDAGDNLSRMSFVSDIPPVKVKEKLVASLLSRQGNKYIYDLKQNMTGVLRIGLKGKSGDKITVRHAEMLNDDGSIYTVNLRRAEATDVCILSGGKEEFRPLFTFHGFRYAEITVEGEAEILNVVGEAMYTDLKTTGSFSCSDEVINRLYSNIVWSQRCNFLNVPTDCPQRDERLGWTGDAQIFVGSAMFNMDCRKFYKKYMEDLRDSQLGSGAIPSVAPVVPHAGISAIHTEIDFLAAGWGEAAVVIPYENYLMYGDKKVLYDSICSMKAFVDYCKESSDGLIRPAFDNYGDWLNVNSDTDAAVLSTLYFVYSSDILAKVCDILGDGEGQKYRALCEEVKRAFRNKFVFEDGKILSDTQTVYLLAYTFGVSSADEIKSHLIRKIHDADDHLSSGFLGIKFLLPVLCELKESDLAYKIFTNRSYPSWGYSVTQGATTVWERWNSYTKEKGFGDAGMNSFNHYSLGSCCEWIFKYCLGINPEAEAPGFERVLIRPFVDFSGKLTSACGSYESVAGKIDVKWKVVNGVAEYSCNLTGKIKAEFDFSAYGEVNKKGNTFYIKR